MFLHHLVYAELRKEVLLANKYSNNAQIPCIYCQKASQYKIIRFLNGIWCQANEAQRKKKKRQQNATWTGAAFKIQVLHLCLVRPLRE